MSPVVDGDLESGQSTTAWNAIVYRSTQLFTSTLSRSLSAVDAFVSRAVESLYRSVVTRCRREQTSAFDVTAKSTTELTIQKVMT